MAVLRDQPNDVPAVARCQKRQERVPDDPSKGQRGQEFFQRILQSTRSHQKGKHWHRRWEQRRNGDRGKSPALENFVNLCHPPCRNPALERFLSPFSRQPVCERSEEHTSELQ